MYNTFKIKMLMLENAYSQKDLAEKTGLSQQTISRILLTGRSSFRSIGKIAKAFNVSTSELIEREWREMLIDVKEVQKILNVKQSTAYKVIRDLNKELQEKGFLIINGKVEKNYLLERYRLVENEYKKEKILSRWNSN